MLLNPARKHLQNKPYTAGAQLGQTLSCSDLGQIALPADRIACAFNAGIA
jgi:hypothetical protein